MLEGEAAGQREREVKGVIDSADIIYYAEGFTQRVFVLYYLFLEHPSPFTRWHAAAEIEASQTVSTTVLVF